MEENGKGLCFVDLLLIVLPAFLIFGAGFIGQKLLKLDIKSISTMSLYLMLPFLTFDTFYSNQLNVEYFYMFLFTCLLAFIMMTLTVLFGFFIKADKTQMSAMLLGTIFPNSGNYGAPVAMFAFGAMGFQYAVIFMVIHAFLMNTIGIFIASYGSEKTTSIKDSFMRVIKMPVLYGFLFGVLFQLLNIELPSTIQDSISLVGSASIPTVMLILGMQLAEIKPQKFELKYVNTVTIFRMLISPLLAVVLVNFMPVNDMIKNVYILLAAMPIAANTTLLAVQFNVKPDLTSFTTLVTTLLSLVTIPLTLLFIK
jgi:predicted permease